MQLGVGTTLFPAWGAALTLVKEHGVDAGLHAAAAIKAPNGSIRLDEAVRAMTSFDHAIDNTRKLPVSWFVKSLPLYYRGYETAKQAVTLLIASNLIPGAKTRVGRQSLLAARDAFVQGVDVARANSTRFGGRLASGWLEATAEDAVTGALMLENGDTGRALLAGIAQVRAQVERRKGLDERLVADVTKLFEVADQQLGRTIELASAQRPAATDATAFAKAGELLTQAAVIAKQAVAATPDTSVLDQAAESAA